MKNNTPPEFSRLEGLAICLSMIGVQLSSEVINQWGAYFYSPSVGVGRTIYVAVGMVGYLFIIGTLWDALTNPVVGAWSDRTQTRPGRWRVLPIRGRRMPFIFWGSILMTFTAVGFWYPPVPHSSILNLIYGTVVLCLHWAFFALAMVPLISLGPEIARSEAARVRIGTWTAVGMLVGLALAQIMPGILIEQLDPARRSHAVQMEMEISADSDVPPTAEETAMTETHGEEVVYSPAGYRRLALILALLSLVMFQIPVWTIRERYDSEAVSETRQTFREEISDAAHNRPFIIYAASFFFFTIGFLGVQRVLPYWAELGLGGSESTVTFMMIPFLVTALLSYFVIPFATRIFHVKWMMFIALFIIASGMPFMYLIGVADWDFSVKMAMGMALFGYCGIGQGIIYVMMTPMMGEIIDYDERRSGKRREALYNGLSGVAWKASMAGSVFIATQSMNYWGNSRDEFTGVLIVGPIAGIFAFIGLIVICFYPKLDVTKKT